MAHAQKPDFVFRRNGRVHLNRWGRQFSRLLAAELCASAVLMLETPCSKVVWRVPATHSISQFPFHFPSRALPCAITFRLDSTSFYTLPSLPSSKFLSLDCIKRRLTHEISFKFNHCSSADPTWPRGLRRGSAAAHLLRLWVRIQPEAWISLCCECCVLSGRGRSLVQRSPTQCGMSECDCESSIMGGPCPNGDWWAMVKKKNCMSSALWQ